MEAQQQPKQLRGKRKKTTPQEREAARRPRFLDRHASYVRHARRALRRVAKLGNKTHYDCTVDEADNILKTLRADMAEVERAFRGAPREKGLYDL